MSFSTFQHRIGLVLAAGVILATLHLQRGCDIQHRLGLVLEAGVILATFH